MFELQSKISKHVRKWSFARNKTSNKPQIGVTVETANRNLFIEGLRVWGSLRDSLQAVISL